MCLFLLEREGWIALLSPDQIRIPVRGGTLAKIGGGGGEQKSRKQAQGELEITHDTGLWEHRLPVAEKSPIWLVVNT